MSRQERGAMRRKLAERKAATIVQEATERVVASRPAPLPQGDDMALAQEVKRLRDGGMSWAAVGAQLSLPGSKNGAGAARRYYAMVNRGEVPRTHAPRKGAVTKPSGPASRAVPAYMRKEALVRDGHVIPRDMPDEEVEALLVGRRIEWAIDMARLTDTPAEEWGGEGRWVQQEARVHVDQRWVKVVWEEIKDGTEERRVYFREYGGRNSTTGEHMSGPTRCVRVDAIFTVA
jgi:hypothetical protein